MPNALDLKRALIDEASRLGLDRLGVCGPDHELGFEPFEAWLAKGYHGPMNYLARHRALRRGARELLPGCRSVIAVSLNYRQTNPPRPGYPRIATYALGRDYHKTLGAKLRALARVVHEADPGAGARVCVDSAPILERAYAHQAGLGWFGKNTCLIDSRRGSWFVIGLLLTTVELPPDPPALGWCGTCRLCVDACPTGCIVYDDGRWQVDARRCVSALTIEHRGPFTPAQGAMLSGWTFGCDVCQEVCPFNQPRASQPLRAVATAEPDFRAVRAWPSLERLARIDEAEWDALTRGSPVRRAGHDGLRRNARANLTAPPDRDPAPPEP